MSKRGFSNSPLKGMILFCIDSAILSADYIKTQARALCISPSVALTSFIQHVMWEFAWQNGMSHNMSRAAPARSIVSSHLQTRELLRRAEEEEAKQSAEQPSTSGSRLVSETPQERWDCESVLSLRSNLDNHPGTISEQSNRRYKPTSGKIKLAAKTG